MARSPSRSTRVSNDWLIQVGVDVLNDSATLCRKRMCVSVG